MTLDELKGLDLDNLKGAEECLFIRSDTPPKITMEKERARSRAGVKGGFIALWQKQH